MRLTIPEEELMTPGHKACQGCGATLAMRYALKALGPRTVVAIPACCWTVLEGEYPYTSLRVPLFHTAFETAASVSAGIKAGLRAKGKGDVTVMAWAGDGGTFDIGIQALSGAAERGDDLIYVCYDNEAYMNTGIQRSSATPYGAWTTTTPLNRFENRPKKDIVEIMVAHGISYAATATIAYPEDLIAKLRKAKGKEGVKFIHILSPCPPGWRFPSNLTVKISRLAVLSRFFPLYEVEDGVYRITVNPRKTVPVEEFLRLQGRFRHLGDEEIERIKGWVEERWRRLVEKAEVMRR